MSSVEDDEILAIQMAKLECGGQDWEAADFQEKIMGNFLKNQKKDAPHRKKSTQNFGGLEDVTSSTAESLDEDSGIRDNHRNHTGRSQLSDPMESRKQRPRLGRKDSATIGMNNNVEIGHSNHVNKKKKERTTLSSEIHSNQVSSTTTASRTLSSQVVRASSSSSQRRKSNESSTHTTTRSLSRSSLRSSSSPKPARMPLVVPQSPGAYTISSSSVSHSVSGSTSQSAKAKTPLPTIETRASLQGYDSTMNTTIANLDDMERDQIERRELGLVGRSRPSFGSLDAESAWVSSVSTSVGGGSQDGYNSQDDNDREVQEGEVDAAPAKPARKFKRFLWIGLIILGCLGVAIALAIAFLTNRGGNKVAATFNGTTIGGDTGDYFIPPALATCLTEMDIQFRMSFVNDRTAIDTYTELVDVVVKPLIPEFRIDRFSCEPQNLALWWLVQEQLLGNLVMRIDKMQQRFSTIVLLLSLREGSLKEPSWLTINLSECLWAGVTCGDRGEVTGFEWDKNLGGSIPNEVALLSNLKVLKLQGTSIVSTIPTNIGSLPLRVLDLSNSYLEWVIPSEIGLLTNLQVLNLDNAALQGTLPTELGLCTSLQSLDLRFLNIGGQIPTELGNLSNLTELLLFANNFASTIPAQICSMPSLTTLAADCYTCPQGIECCSDCA